MKTFFAILIIALVGVNAASLMERYPINYSPQRSIMTLLTQVESQLKAGGPLDAIQSLLSGFATTVTEEQVAHDQLWAEQQAECEDETAFRDDEIANAVSALKEASETLDGCTSQKVRAEGDLALTKKQLVENRNFLVQVEDTRRREAYAFETFSTAFTMVTEAVDEALVILEEIWAGESSFMQLSTHVNGMLKSAIKVKKTHLMSGVLGALVQLAAKDVQADDELLNRVKSLFENFRTKLEESFQEAVAAETAAIEAYNEESARLNETIASLIQQEIGLNAEIKELNKCVVVQQSIVTSATVKRDRNQRLLDDANNLCGAVAEEYRVASEARAEELELLATISERVEARFAEISSGVTERGEMDEFEYNAENDYETDEFVPSV